ncbi:MAG: signal peptidase I, partial [Oscillospiraceae bacterium]|nr:signal peptidase I [Oscillospiraceae bacterium]
MKNKIYLYEDRGVFSRILETLTEVMVVAALGLFLAQYLFLSAPTVSKSMEPTIVPESTVFIDRIVYGLKEPERFDVIAFSRSGTSLDKDVLIRRVIGLPGEEVRISKGV